MFFANPANKVLQRTLKVQDMFVFYTWNVPDTSLCTHTGKIVFAAFFSQI